jgi:hypothetical protein
VLHAQDHTENVGVEVAAQLQVWSIGPALPSVPALFAATSVSQTARRSYAPGRGRHPLRTSAFGELGWAKPA